MPCPDRYRRSRWLPGCSHRQRASCPQYGCRNTARKTYRSWLSPSWDAELRAGRNIQRVIDVVGPGDLPPVARITEIGRRQSAQGLPLDKGMQRGRAEKEALLHSKVDADIFLKACRERCAYRRAIAQEHREALTRVHQHALEAEAAHGEKQYWRGLGLRQRVEQVDNLAGVDAHILASLIGVEEEIHAQHARPPTYILYRRRIQAGNAHLGEVVALFELKFFGIIHDGDLVVGHGID